MSQKQISSLSPSGHKRKREMIEDLNKSDGLENIKDSKSSNLRNERNWQKEIKELVRKRRALFDNIELTWFKALEKEFHKDYFIELGRFLFKEQCCYRVYPREKYIYKFTKYAEIQNVNVVILGQNPIYGPGKSHGLAFSVRRGIETPRTVKNIYKELSTDIPGFKIPSHGCLKGWARQGVLLLNACLTVRGCCAKSHENQGWEIFTDAIIKWINDNLSHVVFILWGDKAQRKSKLINMKKHLILTAAHPCSASAHKGFFGCGHFSKTNEYLQKHNKKPIDWNDLPLKLST